jgi:23S rRNA pseudouridine955/2504/2580 synthase
VRVNKGRVSARYRLQPDDQVRVPPVRLDERREPRPDQRMLRHLEQAVLYEDSRFLVLNKPSGLAVHGGSGLRYGAIEALRALRPDERHLELVHRLDRDTSGCLLIAKRRSALRVLHDLMRGNRIDKRYLALVTGHWHKHRIEVNQPLLKNTLKSGERIVRVDARGKEAVTRFSVQERLAGCQLVEARLLTGRTHQIRVHCAHLGTPILGDEKYGDEQQNRAFRERGLKRLFLHAKSLRFRWPGENRDIHIRAPLGADLEAVLAHLRASSTGDDAGAKPTD